LIVSIVLLKKLLIFNNIEVLPSIFDIFVKFLERLKESLLPTDAILASKNTIGGGGRNQSVKFTLPKDKNPGCRQEAC